MFAILYDVYTLPILFLLAVSVPIGLLYGFWLFKDRDQANPALMGVFCALGGVFNLLKVVVVLGLAIALTFLVVRAAVLLRHNMQVPTKCALQLAILALLFLLLLNGASKGKLSYFCQCF